MATGPAAERLSLGHELIDERWVSAVASMSVFEPTPAANPRIGELPLPRNLACNAIVVGKDVVLNEGCPDTRSKLEELGFGVFETPMSEFIKAGGGAKCLVLKVPHQEEPLAT